MATASVKVFGSATSAEVARVLMCLFEKDVEFQLIRVDAYRGPQRMPQYLKLQPRGEALTFEDDNLTLSESRGILRHISHKYAKQGNPDLIGTGALERASIEQWLQTEAQSFDVPSAKMVYSLAFLPPSMPHQNGNGNGVDFHHIAMQDVDVRNPVTMESLPRDGRTVGEVMIRGNTVMSGYYKDINATKESMAGGWLHTGDLAVRHPDGYIQLMDPVTMESVPSDGRAVREVMLRGNTVMSGYYKDAAATEEAMRGGWLRTGDLAVRHPDGYIQLKDRSKDIIISGGENISSIDVESALFGQPTVLDAAVVERPDDHWGAVNALSKRVAAWPVAASTSQEEEMLRLFEKSQKELEKLLDIYEQRLEEAAYLAGDKFTIADLSHLPNADRLASDPRSRRMFERRRNVSRWWNDVSRREAWAYVKSLQRPPSVYTTQAQNQQHLQPQSGEEHGSNNTQRHQYAEAQPVN